MNNAVFRKFSPILSILAVFFRWACVSVCDVRYLLQFYYHRNERVFRNEDGLFPRHFVKVEWLWNCVYYDDIVDDGKMYMCSYGIAFRPTAAVAVEQNKNENEMAHGHSISKQ